MMATVASLVVDLKANTASFNRAMRDAQSTVKKTLSYTEELQKRESAAVAARITAKNQAIRQQFDEKTHGNIRSAIQALADYEKTADAITNKAAATGGPVSSSLKSLFGKGSALKETLEILKGGGAIVGLGLLAKGFSDIGASVKEMSIGLQQGTKSVNDLIESAVRSVPILGNVAGGIVDLLIATNAGGMRDRIVAQQANAGIGDLFNNINSVISPKTAGQQQIAAMRAQASQISLSGGMGPGQFQMFTRIIDEAERRIQNAENAANAKKFGAPTVDLAKSVYNIDTDPLAQAILDTAKALREAENKFSALADAADRAERTAVLIGVNDPLTQNILDAAQNRRRGLVSAAGGILSQLAAQQNAGPRFAGADIVGSQSEFAGRQRALFAGMNIDRKDEKELAKEAVRLAREQITKQEETNELLKRAVDQAEVVNF